MFSPETQWEIISLTAEEVFQSTQEMFSPETGPKANLLDLIGIVSIHSGDVLS